MTSVLKVRKARGKYQESEGNFREHEHFTNEIRQIQFSTHYVFLENSSPPLFPFNHRVGQVEFLSKTMYPSYEALPLPSYIPTQDVPHGISRGCEC